jgi:NAD(P)-dependent dehydrogenase (short-subunit alcohol dehydrogenase family)
MLLGDQGEPEGERDVLLDNQGVVITGASQGIGKATALVLAEEGARVVLTDVNDEVGEAAAEEVRATGATATYLHCDVSDEAQVVEMIARATEFLGGLDLAVNNAGIAHAPIDLHELDTATWQRVMNVTLFGTFLCMREELKVMVAAGHGSIVNMASNAGVKNAPGMAGYTTAKHGVVGLTKNAALQYARRNIRVNAVCPGTIATETIASYPAELQKEWSEMIPMGRIGTPREVAQSVAYLLSEQAGFITGVPLLIDGGLMFD